MDEKEKAARHPISLNRNTVIRYRGSKIGKKGRKKCAGVRP